MEAKVWSFDNELIAEQPSLRAFAISLSGNATRADDLVQETLLRALANRDSFQPGSNFPAWLFTILRNLFRSDYRKRKREVEDAEGNYAKTLKTQPSQNAHMDFEDFRAALDKLPQDQREALILVGSSGYSYDDAAAICGCAIGTIKSRVNRARAKLHAMLDTFELGELNKSSWFSDESIMRKEPKATKKYWEERRRERPVRPKLRVKRVPLLPAPAPSVAASPVRHIKPETVTVVPKQCSTKLVVEPAKPLSAVLKPQEPIIVPAEAAPPKPAPQRIIKIAGVSFVFAGQTVLPSGKTQQIYKVVE